VTPGAGELTVASFNVHWGRASERRRYRPFDVVDACRELDADVLVLQETWAPDGSESQHAAVARALGHLHMVVEPLGRAVEVPEPKVVSRPDPSRRRGTGDWCLALLSRRPAVVHPTAWLPQLPTDPAARAVLRADVEAGDGRFLAVCGTHLAHLEMGAPIATRALRAALPDPATPGILLGDMNMWGWCIGPMAGRGWQLHGKGATFPAARPMARIDHLLATASVEVLSTEVLPDLGSDHRAIRARLRVAPT
jgi:endonuclease/exonuclease/phosphatase family metal-dependent hydrolase